MLLVFLVTGAAHANYESRVALVIGNAEYTGVPALKNAVNDADLISSKLRRLGFDVLRFENLDYRGLNRAVREFGDVLQSAGEDTAALFYYAGHAVQVSGSNYLIPVDARIRRESDFLVEAVDMNTVLGTMEYARNPLNIIVLDACRDNPFTSSSRGLTRGLARMDAPTGTLIAYATAPGKAALDGDGNNSPYTLALADTIAEPGLPIEQMFKKVRINVMKSTGNQQIPWEASSLTGDFYFSDARPKAISKTPQAAPPVTATNPSPPAFSQQAAPTDQNTQATKRFEQSPSITATVPSDSATGQPSANPAFTTSATPSVAKTTQNSTPKFAVSAATDNQPTQVATIAPTATSNNTGAAGHNFKDCPTCPTMVVVPSGQFMMGSAQIVAANDSAAALTRSIRVPKSFAIGKFEVTFAEWDACVKDKGCQHQPQDYGWGRSNRPVVDVSWQHAQEYVAWLRNKTGKQYRLPSEAEWEYAAKGGQDYRYPWGNELISNRANCWNCGSRWGNKQTAPVGSFLPNQFGISDMAGNVWEWTEDCWNKSTAGLPAQHGAVTDGNCRLRVLRGGAWMTQPDSLTVFNRTKQNVRFHRNFTGFRVAVSLD